ncbi:MAG: 4-hydroxythreonine-4-phosphate dehydrogenase PdxA [Prevotella sp.]|nr:4-hydroxythreonine-4-phosphate dehydrogenase PdxA [Prevotella sp.]
MENKKIRIAITHGDTNGIGYELIFKTFAETEMLEMCTPIVYGSPKVAAYHRKALDIPANFSIISRAEDAQDGRLNVLTSIEEEVKVDLTLPTEESGKAAVKALDRAIDDGRNGLYDALVVGPMTNACLMGGNEHAGNIADYLGRKFENKNGGLTIMSSYKMRVASVNENVDMRKAVGNITRGLIEKKATTMFTAMKRDFLLSNPRVALLALNPSGKGEEETNIMKPLVEELEEKGIMVFGPYAAEQFFGQGDYEAFDGILAMYDDQGIVPMKMLNTDTATRLITGLPVACTLPEVDDIFTNAGRCMADESELRQAIYCAIDVARNRAKYDESHRNPLPKLFHEKKDDSEKVRFAVPKNKETKATEE